MDCTEIQLKVETGASYDIRWLQEEEMVYKTLWYYFKIITKTNGIENWRWKERMKCFKLLIHRVCDRPIYIAFLKNKYMIYFINKKKRQFWVVACQRYRGYCYGRFVFAPWCLSVFFKSSTISMYFFFFYCCSSTVFCLFPPPQPNTPTLPTSLPFPPHQVNCPCVLYNCSYKPFTLFPCNSLHSPLWSLSACSQFQCLWLCLLICFLDYVPIKGEIIWYLSFIACLISHSILLSSSIHAVAKGRSSFFLSAA